MTLSVRPYWEKMKSFENSGNVPNKETLEAIDEVKRMKADSRLGKTYSDVDEMIKDLLENKNHLHIKR